MNGKIISDLIITMNGNIQVITISHIEENNSLTGEMQKDLLDILTSSGRDESIRGIIIRGDGEVAFSSGGSMSYLQKINSEEDVEKMYQVGSGIVDVIRKMPKPVIAAVSGWCIGAGFEIALACDLIYASDTAVFQLPEFAMGIFPDWGGAAMLSRRIGLTAAREMLYFGKMMTAAEGLERGLINKVIAPAKLFRQSEKLLTKLIVQPAASVAAYKRFLSQEFCDMPMSEARKLIHESSKEFMLSDTFRNNVNNR